MLKDLEPSLIPPKQINDPKDVKPADWDDRDKIDDPHSTKPEDWDQPKEIEDEGVQKPEDWLEEVEPDIPDTGARKPNDWDDEIDGEWEPKKIPNPQCAGHSGCGSWKRPLKLNPLYKGKWIPAKIANPNYKGQWTSKLIDNPNYFEADPYKQLQPIGAVGIELWTMSSGIVFDNIIITDSEEIAEEFRKGTFDFKRTQEDLYQKTSNPSTGMINELVKNFLEAAEERPWIWVATILAILIPIVLISLFCFGRKSSTERHKKTDEPSLDDEKEDEFEKIDMSEEVESPSKLHPTEKKTI